MATTGPGVLTSWSVGGTSVNAQFVDAFSGDNEQNTFQSAKGIDVARGYVCSQQGTVWTWGASDATFDAINTLMKNRTLSSIIATFVDGSTDTLSQARVMVRPVLSPVPDNCKVYIATAGTTADNLTGSGSWTDLGVTIGESAPETSLNSHTDGCGRPYYSFCRLQQTFMLPDIAHSALDTFADGLADVAVEMPDGNFSIIRGGWIKRKFSPLNADDPRSISMMVDVVDDDWDTILSYVNGANPTSAAVDRPNFFHGYEIVCTGFGYDETDRVTRA